MEINYRKFKKIAYFLLIILIAFVFLIQIFPKSEVVEIIGTQLKGIIKLATWDVSTGFYNNQLFNFSAQSNDNTGLSINGSGNKMYFASPGTDRIYRYNLSTPWNISTATYDNNNCSVLTQENDVTSFFINKSGERMFIVGNQRDAVISYTLTNAWNLTSCSNDNINFSLGIQQASGLFFNETGTKMFVLFVPASTNLTIHQYTLSQAWNVSSATHSSDFFNISAVLSANGRDLYIRPDGKKFYITSNEATDKIYQFNMSSAWNTSTSSYENKNFSIAGEETTPLALYFDDFGTNFYVAGNARKAIYQYSVNDTEAPMWSNNYTNSTTAGTTINHSVNWTDDLTLNTSIFSLDNGNTSFLNYSIIPLTGRENQSNFSFTVNDTIGVTIRWMVYTNDSFNNLNVTDTFAYNTTAANCWGYDDSTNTLYVPTGCTYYQPGTFYIG